MKPTAQADEIPSSSNTKSSARASVSRFGTSLGASGRGGLLRPSSSTKAATSQSFALATQPLPQEHAERDEDARGEEPRHESLGHRADVTEGPAAAAVGALRALDVADERGEIGLRDRLLRERRQPRPPKRRAAQAEAGRPGSGGRARRRRPAPGSHVPAPPRASADARASPQAAAA